MREDDHPELGVPRWLPVGDDGQALAVRVHLPRSGTIRRTLVIAPPLGREQVISSRTLRVLAIRAARDSGALVLRASWGGTGESTGELPEDPAAAWGGDLVELIREGRRLAPGVPVAVVGLRLGAAIAASVLDHAEAPEATLLWEPIPGRRFVREQKALRIMALTQPVAGEGVELPGLLLSDPQASSLGRLSIPAGAGDRDGVQLLVAAPEQRQVIEKAYGTASRDAEVPSAIVDDVIHRLMRSAAEPASAPSAEEVAGKLAERPASWRAPGPGGVLITQEFVEIGEHRLPGVLTTASEGAAARPEGAMAGMVLIAADAEPMDGPTGLWTRTARALAAEGTAVLRSDRRGIGEAAGPEELSEPMPYTEEAVHDVAAAILLMRRRVDGPVVGAGLCSGAWFALRCAHEGLDLVGLLNNIAWSPRGDYYWRHYGRDDRADDGGARRMVRLLRRLSPSKRQRDAIRRAMPGPVRRGFAAAGKLQSVDQMFTDPSTMPPVVICIGDDDTADFELAGGRREVRRLSRQGFDIRIESLGRADHALLSASSRGAAVAALHRLAAGSPPGLTRRDPGSGC